MSNRVHQLRGAESPYRVAPYTSQRAKSPLLATVHSLSERPNRARAEPRLRAVKGERGSSLSAATGIVVAAVLSLGLWASIALALWLL